MTCTYDLDPAALSLDERLTALCDVEREIARLQARSLRLVAAIADDPCAGSVVPALDREWHKEELRAALGESAVSVGHRIALAQSLSQRLPATLAALESATITVRHARALSEAVAGLDDNDVIGIEAEALRFAPGRDLTAFVRKVRREVLTLDSRTVEERFAAALADRRVWGHCRAGRDEQLRRAAAGRRRTGADDRVGRRRRAEPAGRSADERSAPCRRARATRDRRTQR